MQVLSYAQVVIQAIPVLLGEDSEWPPGRTEEQKLKKVHTLDQLVHAADAPHGQLRMLYDLNLRIGCADAQQSRKWTRAARSIQRAWRWKRFRLLVMANLDHRAHTNPLVLAMEHGLQMHGIEHLIKASSSVCALCTLSHG